MSEERKLAACPTISFAEPSVVEMLEKLLERARAGEIRAIGAAYELTEGYTEHGASFGRYSSRNAVVGRLYVLARHIVLNEILE